MAFFALLWKARTIEKYRLNYEKEKINSIVMGNTELEQTLSQRWRHYRYDTKKRISRTFRKWYPEGSSVANFFLYLRTDQTFPNFLLKSVMGFVGGIVLTYLCFMFFVFQLSISLIHATIMSSIIGVLLTLGLAFSYRIRCLVFLLIPQFFSRVGRYTLTCYALVLILTGPATNTLKNSEVLSESMACSQEQIKTSVHQLNDLMKKPYNAMKESIKLMVDRLKVITMKMKQTVVSLDRLVLSLVSLIQSSFSWLQSVADICNAELGTPYDRCSNVLQDGISECKKAFGQKASMICDVAQLAHTVCYVVKPFSAFCYVTDFMDEAILASIKKKLRNFTEHLRAMFYVEVHIHQSYSFSSNTSRSASQVAAGIVTEIRNRADPLLTWLSWSSCVTSLFLLLIIFRAKYYQHMYETRSRFDNRYVTKELRELDLKRQRQGRETVLPLNRRERAKYVTTTSFRLVASEKVYLNRSAVFMAITTFKLLIHMVADYSLYWVLMTIRFHGRYQSDLMPGIPHSGVHVSGSGFVARLFRSIVETLDIPLASPSPSPISCLPDPYPPDLRRYTQIGVLIFLLWFFALFEPYGLRLRHLIMGHYRPERAKARATWLYNHILRTRAGFMKFARRKLHREYKYSSEASLTFRIWMEDHIPFLWLKSLLGFGQREPHCLLCGTTRCLSDPDTQLTRCQTPSCPGVFCISCFTDIGELCTICLTPADYGDYSDVSLEKGSTDDSDSDPEDGLGEQNRTDDYARIFQNQDRNRQSRSKTSDSQRWGFFTKTGSVQNYETFPLQTRINYYDSKQLTTSLRNQLRKIKSSIIIRYWDKKYTKTWVSNLTLENSYEDITTYKKTYRLYTNKLDIGQYSDSEESFIKTRSIGTNTDKKRGMILKELINRFTTVRTRWKTKRQKRVKSGLSQVKALPLFSNRVKGNIHENVELNGRTLECNTVKPQNTCLTLNKTFHVYNLNTCQKQLMKIVKYNKEYKTKSKINIYTGTINAMRCYTINNDVTSITNQNNEIVPNNTPDQNNDEITKPPDIPQEEEKINKKKTSKINKPKKPKKPKECNKIKVPNLRNRISEFHTFISNHWNHFKCSLMPCATHKRPDGPTTKEKKNHKRRKKRKNGADANETDKDKCLAKKDIRHTRNLRISAFLAELEWTKRDYKKGKENEVNDGSILFTEGVPAPITKNKIVGMVHMKNLPFPWRQASKSDCCNCDDDRCTCKIKVSENKQSEKNVKLDEPQKSKQKTHVQKALNRLRNKINTADSLATSLMEKVITTVAAESANKTVIDVANSVSMSKQANFYGPFTADITNDNDVIDTDLLFKNENYMDDLAMDPSDLKATSSRLLNHFIGRELIVSRSSNERKSQAKRKCRCDYYEDMQRKWTHVKKCISQKVNTSKHPIMGLKDFCSSLFGPSCTLDTCPNRLSKKQKLDKERAKQQKKLDKQASKRKCKQPAIATQTNKVPKNQIQIAIQTQGRKDMQCQKESDDIVVPKREDALVKINDHQQKEIKKSCEPRDKLQMKLLKTGTNSDCKQKGCGCTEKKLETSFQADTEKSRDPACKKEKVKEKVKIREKEPECNRENETAHKKEEGNKRIEKCFVSIPVQTSSAFSGNQINVTESDKITGACLAVDCPNVCNQFVQYNEKDAQKKSSKKTTAVGSGKSLCDQAVQIHLLETCTCATQHVTDCVTRATSKPSPVNIRSFMVDPSRVNAINKKILHRSTKSHKAGLMKRRKLSLESSICALDRERAVSEAVQEVLTDTITDSSQSSVSIDRSDETRTDTTFCSLATIDFDDIRRRRKFRVKVVTKTNQATLTDKTKLCDTGTVTSDWWSPLVERKAYEEILLEKKKGYNAIEKQKKELRELKEWKELKDVRKRRRTCGVTTDGRIVTFRSRTQIIPTGLFPTAKDIMSPSRYLLESQKYYNELFSYNFRPPPQASYCVNQVPKYYGKEKTRSPLGSRRNHHHKTKRLDECYSPRIQPFSRKRNTDSTKTVDSPRRKTGNSHRHYNNRYYSKCTSPRTRYGEYAKK